jgi:succinate dehydrogenase/fumarate reductase flavoprotein subunit
MNTLEGVSSAQLLKKTDPEEFDLVILGGGTGSTIAAWTFASEGKRVALIDRKYIGGSCPNSRVRRLQCSNVTLRESLPPYQFARDRMAFGMGDGVKM